jgi:hypothetical protein
MKECVYMPFARVDRKTIGIVSFTSKNILREIKCGLRTPGVEAVFAVLHILIAN